MDVIEHLRGVTNEYGFYLAQLNGRSSRGDICIGSYIAKRLTLDPHEAGRWTAAVTSLKMENLGPFNRSMQEVEELIQRKYQHRSNGGAIQIEWSMSR